MMDFARIMIEVERCCTTVDAMTDAEITLTLEPDELAELVNLVAEETLRRKDQMLLLAPIHSKLLDAVRGVEAKQAVSRLAVE